ncbi:MAG: YitT family protein, partial [Candidatus Krumholzibacteria bacterium]|nr:YitT family protein [Candidatus Krumholzibacteria bacterium]
VAGGLTGLAVIARLALGVPFSVALLALNVPLLIMQWRLLGGFRSIVRTMTGVTVLAVMTEVLQPLLPAVTEDRLLIITYGGVLAGLGLAMVFQGRGTTGGADILARLFNRYRGWRIGRTMLGLNVIVYTLAGLLFGPEPAMVALLLSYVMSRTLDAVLHGLASSRVVMIVTAEPGKVRQAVVHIMGRGLTLIPATGGHSGRRKGLLYAVIPRADIQRLKLRVLDSDPEAFITVMTPREAVGGFNLKPQD